MSTYTCSTEPDAAKRPPPTQNSTADVIGRWTHRAYRMSHDEKTVITNREDGIIVRQGDKEVTYEMNLRGHTRREFMFSPDNKRVAFWAPMEEGKEMKRVALLNLTHLTPGEPDMKIVYDPPSGTTPFGLEWSPAADALFVIERATVSG